MFRTKKSTPRVSRRLFTECLEKRAMMASDVVHNFLLPHDVNDDHTLSPVDALVVINRLNRDSTDDNPHTNRLFHDVNDDSTVTPLDALLVINSLNSSAAGGNGTATPTVQASVLPAATGSPRVRVELEIEGVETELNIKMDGAPVSKSFPVKLADIAIGQLVTDAKGRGKLVLSQGDDNSSHLPLPSSLIPLRPEMELIIGDLVQGKLSDVTRIDDRGNATGGGNGGSTTPSQNLELVAPFETVQGVVRSAEYEQETERGVTKRKFEAEIEHAPKNTAYEVTVDGVVVGTVTTDSKGKAKLRLTHSPKMLAIS